MAAPSLPDSRLRLIVQLNPDFDAKPRGRCPIVRFLLHDEDGQRAVATHRTDAEVPTLELPDATIGRIDAGDALSRAMDEEAWLRELRRVLAPGGTLSLAFPASGPLAWLDARNLYRYVTDIIGRGDAPDDPLPTGWNRHYAEDDIRGLLDRSGLQPVRMKRAGVGLTEVPQIAGLMAGNFLLGKRDTEMRLFPLRKRMEALERRLPAPGIGTTLLVMATRRDGA